MKRKTKKAIEPQKSVQEFFRTLVTRAIKNLKIEVSELAEFYLVNLLNDFTKTENVYVKKGKKLEEEPLAIMLKRAVEADRETQVKILKKLGDFSLYISGYFPESISKLLVDTDYYIKMGENAYNNLSKLMTAYKHLSNLYLELAVKFALFTQVLTIVSKEGGDRSCKELLHMYENWLKTGNKQLEEFLAKQGFSLDRSIAKKLH